MAKSVLQSTRIENLADTKVIQQILPALPVSKLDNVSGSDVLGSYSKLLAANRNSTSNLISSTQVKNFA